MTSPLPAFKLERFFAQYEFVAPYLLCCSDCQPLSMSEVLELADAEAREMWKDLRLGYTETAGLPALREEISKQYSTISKDDITVLAPEEGVYLAMRAVLRAGDSVVCTFPGYQSLYSIAKSMGCTITHWEPELMPVIRDKGKEAAAKSSCSATSLSFNVDALLQILKASDSSTAPPVKMVIMNFPHNPTGFLPNHEDWSRLVEACKTRGCYLFSDEMYRGLELDASCRLPAACDCYDQAISLCGVSKSLGLPGLRIGWLASKAQVAAEDELVYSAAAMSSNISPATGDHMNSVVTASLQSRVRELKDYTTICSSAPSEVLSLIALRSADKIMHQHVTTIQGNVEHAHKFFSLFPNMFEWQPPVAGSVTFPRLTTGENIDAFCDRVVKGCGVLLLPSSVYDHPHSIERGNFRLGLGRSNARECFDRLREYLEKTKTI
ncbi:hypothetical protein CEUSTIGMA_g4515.t1 [Chlamydomonas eustigma]|uniref:Aminotransferase class I/classII large domain-containing protein n=1 Tax=Chlamydomonas eustigma TaxID=1157962 RepID=A0A250X2A5_9CHLO|nr:hypothetical protein CEUSTIGMA_g4515.t1 [Chlamydomonas eustigma]|eukprot:GAX77069.1 hypothetical protein CEUSTIGMA_g4515.t1 [Chlamydomonas eustigma]